MEVITKKPIEVEVEKIVFDESNPNRMEREQIESLKLSLRKYGNVHPVILDEKFVVADGHHRVIAYKELGMTTVPAVIISFANDGERRLMRQVMNKLHGKHDPNLDISELKDLMEYDQNQLLDLLQIDNDYLSELVRVTNEQKQILGTVTGGRLLPQDVPEYQEEMLNKGDANPVDHKQESYLKGNIKQITVYFTNEEYMQIIPRIENALRVLQLGNNTDLFVYLLGLWERYSESRSQQATAEGQ